MSELKPCPHCESPATLFTSDEVGYLGVDHFTVKCNSCFCGTGHYADPARAIEAWNRRSQPDNAPLCKEDENFIQTKYGYCFYAMGPRPIIYNLYVHPQYRRRGYSKALLEIAMREIWKGEYKGEIHIQAEPREGSISRDDLMEYYDRMGLSVIGNERRPDNAPLTLEELRGMDDPVWCACDTFDGKGGFWCLCHDGTIIPPSGMAFDAAERPIWTFYRRKPEQEGGATDGKMRDM